MGDRTKVQLMADRRTVEALRAIGAEFRRNREDQGLPQRSVAAAGRATILDRPPRGVGFGR